MLKHLSSVSDFQKTGYQTNFFLTCLGALMEMRCLGSHENNRELGSCCCSRGPAVDRNWCRWAASPLRAGEGRRVECVFSVLCLQRVFLFLSHSTQSGGWAQHALEARGPLTIRAAWFGVISENQQCCKTRHQREGEETQIPLIGSLA